MNEPVYETNTKSKRKYEYKMMKQSLRRTFYITHNIMELAIQLIQDWHGVTDSTGKYWVDLRRSWKYIKIPEFINKKYISYFNILCLSFMRHLLIIIFFLKKSNYLLINAYNSFYSFDFVGSIASDKPFHFVKRCRDAIEWRDKRISGWMEYDVWL